MKKEVLILTIAFVGLPLLLPVKPRNVSTMGAGGDPGGIIDTIGKMWEQSTSSNKPTTVNLPPPGATSAQLATAENSTLYALTQTESAPPPATPAAPSFSLPWGSNQPSWSEKETEARKFVTANAKFIPKTARYTPGSPGVLSSKELYRVSTEIASGNSRDAVRSSIGNPATQEREPSGVDVDWYVQADDPNGSLIGVAYVNGRLDPTLIRFSVTDRM